MTPSDVANVRDVAWSCEHELEMDTGFQTSFGEKRDVRIEFDASAVFEHELDQHPGSVIPQQLQP